jgi:hypothetical protein
MGAVFCGTGGQKRAMMVDPDCHRLFFLKLDILISCSGEKTEMERSPVSGCVANQESSPPLANAMELNAKVTSFPVLDRLGKPMG